MIMLEETERRGYTGPYLSIHSSGANRDSRTLPFDHFGEYFQYQTSRRSQPSYLSVRTTSRMMRPQDLPELYPTSETRAAAAVDAQVVEIMQ